MKQKIIALLAMIILLSISIAPVNAQENGKITVTTTFLADIIDQLAPDTFDVVSIVPAGGDPHLYTASAQDLSNIMDADLVLYHGLHFEAQMAEVLEQVPTAHKVSEHFNTDDLVYVSENSVDPHFWFDIDLYKQAVQETESILAQTFPDLKSSLEENSATYLAKLDELSNWIDKELEKLPVEERILVTPHDAFTYFARSHDFTIYAPQGISTESEASNDSIKETVNYIVSHNVPAIFLDTTSNPQAMKKLQEGVEQAGNSVQLVGGEGQELYSDSLAATGKENDNYIDMYRHNVSLIINHLVK